MTATLLESVPLTRTTPASTTTTRAPRATGKLWTGRILTGIAILFLTFDVVVKLLNAAPAVEGTVQLGFPAHLVVPIGAIGLVCLILYIIPRTAPLGALLWTGYFGGAIATQLRLEHPLFSQTLAPLYAAVIVWGGLYLRDARVRAILGARR